MRAVLMLACAVLLASCGGERTSPPPVSPTVLAAADLADGQADRVVHRCAVCNLGMDGSIEHVSLHAGYTFHLCSAHCKETFDHDPEAVLRRLPGKSWPAQGEAARAVPPGSGARSLAEKWEGPRAGGLPGAGDAGASWPTSNATCTRQPPCALWVAGGVGPSAALSRLADGAHRLRRSALHLAPRRPQRGPSAFSDRLLECRCHEAGC